MQDKADISFHVPSIGEEEIAEVVDTLRSGWLTTGRRTEQFEREFREYVGAPHALAVNSCTAALHLALISLGIGSGDEVITTPLTFCATVNAILHVGATPVLADIGPDGNLDVRSVEERITRRTRAILPVHFAGLPCRMDAIWDLARRYGLQVIEDAAHAAGATYDGRRIGASGDGGPESDAVAFSFYATKNITTGEGGMVTTPRADIAQRMRILCLHGISADAWKRYSVKGNWKYSVVECGWKYNLSDIQSAIGIHQLRKLDSFTQAKTALARRYSERLCRLDEVETPAEFARGTHAWHLYCIRLRTELLSIDRDEFILELREYGIGASVHFIPIPLHPAYAGICSLSADLCPRAMEMYPRLVTLPLYPSMTESQADRVIDAVEMILTRHRSHSRVRVSSIAV